jgi:predicted  nucleic acid-binding Zn-ribbon protein
MALEIAGQPGFTGHGLRVIDFQRDFVGATPQEIYRDLFEIEDRDVRFQELYARLPELPELRRKLESAKAEKSQDRATINRLEEEIDLIERTKKEQETKLDSEALEEENSQLAGERDALHKRDGSEVA